MLKYRILTAIILIPLVIWAIIGLSQAAFSFFAAAIMLLAAWEWAAFLEWTEWKWRLFYILIVLLAIIASIALPNWLAIIIGTMWWTIALIFIFWIEARKTIPTLHKSIIAIIGILTFIPAWRAIVILHLEARWLLLLLLLVWAVDTAAYFGGRFFGKNKLAPTISPNKTWAGAYSALIVVTAILALGVWLIFNSAQPMMNALTLAVSVTIAAIVGDLFESVMKRHSHVKDSGNILPGHGGLLDRIDSLLAAAPIFLTTALSTKMFP